MECLKPKVLGQIETPQGVAHVLAVSIQHILDTYFDDSSLPSGGSPEAVIIGGPPASGKTTYRKRTFSRDHVLIDAADLFLRLSAGEVLPFPDALEKPMGILGGFVASKAISERRNIVTEIIGDDEQSLRALIAALQGAGYTVRLTYVDAPLEQCLERNVNRGDDDISAFFAQQFNIEWIVTACGEGRCGG